MTTATAFPDTISAFIKAIKKWKALPAHRIPLNWPLYPFAKAHIYGQEIPRIASYFLLVLA